MTGSVLGFCAGWLSHCNRSGSTAGFACDTVTVVRHDTLRVITPSAVGVTELGLRMMSLPVWRCVDAESCSVAVGLPVERKVYSDSTYRAVVSGVGVTMDSLEIYTRHTVSSVMRVPASWREKRWVIGPSVGIGFDGQRFRPFAGVALTYRFMSF